MIWPRLNQPWCSKVHEAKKRTIANAAAAAAAPGLAGGNQLRERTFIALSLDDRFPRRRGRQGRVRNEWEEPRDVEVEPVRQHELEAEQQHAGQRRELERRLAPRNERERDGREHEEHLEHTLREMQVGQSLCVVLLPVPDRERRVARDLPRHRTIPEHPRRMADVRLEQENRERTGGGEHETGDERGE